MAKRSLSQNPVGAYVYEIIVDGVVRYIGKGRGGRRHKHLKIAQSLNQRRAAGEKLWARHLYNSLANALKDGLAIQPNVVRDGMSDAEAFDLERSLIASCDRNELWNSTDGGDGNTSEYAKRLWQDPEFREKRKKAHSAATSTKEFSEKSSRQLKMRWSDPENRRDMAETQRARFATDPDHTFRKPITDADKKQNRDARRREWSDDEYRAKQMAARLARWDRPGQIEKTAKAMKAVWADPELRAKMAETIRQKWRDPAYREAMLASRGQKKSASC